MIRFDEVPIGRRFNDSNGLEHIKLESFMLSEDYNEEDYWPNALTTFKYDGLLMPKTFKPDEMVELIDKCANCRYFDTSGECMMGVVDQGNGGNIIIDTENFWCSEGIIKGD